MDPFQDGLSAQFSYVWMRDNSDKRPSLLHLDMNSKPEVSRVAVSNQGITVASPIRNRKLKSITVFQNCYSDEQKVQVIWPPFLASEYTSKVLVFPNLMFIPARKSCLSGRKMKFSYQNLMEIVAVPARPHEGEAGASRRVPDHTKGTVLRLRYPFKFKKVINRSPSCRCLPYRGA